MPYRKTKKAAQQQRLEAMQRGKERARMARAAPDYPAPVPDLRIRIKVERFDFGHETKVFEFRKARRCDQYRVFVDGQPWKQCGISVALANLRKALPRTSSARRYWP